VLGVLPKECHFVREKQSEKTKALSNGGIIGWAMVQQTPFAQLRVKKV